MWPNLIWETDSMFLNSDCASANRPSFDWLRVTSGWPFDFRRITPLRDRIPSLYINNVILAVLTYSTHSLILWYWHRRRTRTPAGLSQGEVSFSSFWFSALKSKVYFCIKNCPCISALANFVLKDYTKCFGFRIAKSVLGPSRELTALPLISKLLWLLPENFESRLIFNAISKIFHIVSVSSVY